MNEEPEAFISELQWEQSSQSRAERVEIQMSRGQAAAIQGMFLVLCSVLVYCVIAFREGASIDLAEILQGAQPLAAAALLGIAGGMALWVFGCAAYLRASMEVEANSRDR